MSRLELPDDFRDWLVALADAEADFVLIGGWTVRLLLLAVAASFLRAVLDLLPKFAHLRADAPGMAAVAPVAADALLRWRRIVAGASVVQWLAVLTIYVKLVL